MKSSRLGAGWFSLVFPVLHPADKARPCRLVHVQGYRVSAPGIWAAELGRQKGRLRRDQVDTAPSGNTMDITAERERA